MLAFKCFEVVYSGDVSFRGAPTSRDVTLIKSLVFDTLQRQWRRDIM